eukprot:INCI13094.2.p1 GENE.INCI13094.2~~INCI13094.2.p1  ORF type:complete len:554 (+),score=113.69 INCI13094.2:238-1899(+)
MAAMASILADARAFVDARSPWELTVLAASTFLVLGITAALLKLAARRPPTKDGPKWHWFVGSTFEFMHNFTRIHEWFLDGTRDYGKWVHAWSGSMLSVGQFSGGMVCLVTPDEVRHVLKDNFDNYEKGELVHDVLREFFGDGIFSTDGPRWKVHRKVAVHMFSKKLMVDGTEVALRQARKLVDRLDRAAMTGESLDIQPAFYAFTMDTFCSIAFGIELESQAKPHAFSEAFDTVQELSARRFRKPFWQLERLIGTKDEQEIKAGVKLMDEFATEVIESKRRVLKDKNQALGVDLVTRFLDNANKRGETLSTRELRDIVINFIIAGRDTTASALSWSVFEMCREPRIADIIRQELARVIPDGRSLLDMPKDEAFEVLSSGLIETKAVVMEVLRLHPSVAVDIKQALKADVLPSGVKVPAGTAIVYCPFAMGRNPKIWPDPMKFDHTRFMTVDESADGEADTESAGGDKDTPKKGRRISVYRPSAVSDYKYPVFNAGPRLCLGRPLAILEIQMMLCILVQRYDFKPSKEHKDKAKVTVVACSEDGVPVYVTRREQ